MKLSYQLRCLVVAIQGQMSKRRRILQSLDRQYRTTGRSEVDMVVVEKKEKGRGNDKPEKTC